MNTLVIGDAHLRIGRIDEAKSFITQLLEQIKSGKYDNVVLLGDQFDNFAVVRSEILSLWSYFFNQASKMCQVIALVGNHDLAGAEGGTNPMEPFKSFLNVWIVQDGLNLNGVHYFPFMRDTKEFEQRCRELPAGSVLFCHQSFNGAQFENGFYDPHGADPSCVAHLSAVISGHIHKAQNLANIWYPGTPFQHSFGDAGHDKFIYEINLHDKGYNVVSKIGLKMPKFAVLEVDSISELREVIRKAAEDTSDLSLHQIKVIARGTPSEIVEFWNDSETKAFKARCKNLVDGLTSIRIQASLPKLTGKSQQERLKQYVNTKTWRTNSERLSCIAAEFLTD